MSVVDDVKQKIDIVDVIGSYVTLKKAGRNFKALCPFHNEKTPSFIVFPEQGTWHCFGSCSTGGDAFSFLMKRENIDFGEALRRLAQRAGVELIREGPGEDAERKRLREILATAAAHYHYLLKHHPAAQGAREYVAKRNLKPATVELFELGFALNEWEALKAYLVGKGYALRDIQAAGLLVTSERGTQHDRFRGRLMFPIRNRSGEVIGFGARTLTGEEPKYLNSPQTPLFDKSGTLYGLDLAKDAIRQQNLAVIVEGYMDVIGAHQGGFKNVVASLGTALTEKQLGLLKRLTNRYALALDPDAAGEEATKRGLEVARGALDRKTVPLLMDKRTFKLVERLEGEMLVIALPGGKDPDDLIHENPAQWLELVDRAEPLIDFYFRIVTEGLDLKIPSAKNDAIQRLLPVISEIKAEPIREHYLDLLSRLTGVAKNLLVVQANYDKTAKKRDQVPVSWRLESISEALSRTPKLEEYVLTLALNTPEHLARIGFLDSEDFTQADCRALFIALCEIFQPTELFDREAFRATLDELLIALHDRLIGEGVPDLSEPELGREIESAAHRLRLQHDKMELARIEVLLRDRDEERTTEDVQRLQERVGFLLKRLMDSQRALGARTMLNRV